MPYCVFLGNLPAYEFRNVGTESSQAERLPKNIILNYLRFKECSASETSVTTYTSAEHNIGEDLILTTYLILIFFFFQNPLTEATAVISSWLQCKSLYTIFRTHYTTETPSLKNRHTEKYSKCLMRNGYYNFYSISQWLDKLRVDAPNSMLTSTEWYQSSNNHSSGFNSLNAELNPSCHLLALVGAHHILHVSRVRVGHKPAYLYRNITYGTSGPLCCY